MTRVLIVEDEVISALAMRSELEQLGHAVCTLAASADEAMRIAEAERPEVVVMDLNLGQRPDGIELAQSLHERLAIPSLLVSGYPRSQIADRLDAAFCIGYLSKPVRTTDIAAAIERFFTGS